MKVTVNQEILNLEKMIDSLHTDLRHVEETFGKDDIAELSKRWSQLLAETQAFVDYFFESYRDISKNNTSFVFNANNEPRCFGNIYL
jgi:hypothetical protein